MTEQSFRPRRGDFRALFRLAGPIVLVQVGLVFMGVVDTVMVGQLSAVALAAVALANVYFFGIVVFALGALMALDPIISQALGAGDELAVRRGVQRGFLLAAVLSLPTSLALLTAEPVLDLVRQPAEVIPLATGYVERIVPSVLPFLAFVVLRQTLQAHHRTAPIVVTILISNLVNAGLNYLWIFGELGFPALGAMGSAWATLASRWLMLLMLLALGWPYVGVYLRRLAPFVFAYRPLARMLRLGAPIGSQMLLEWGAFATIALLMGGLGVTQVAAHQVAINLAALTFMVPFGMSSASAVIVGRAVGRGDAGAVRRCSRASLLLGAGFMMCTAALFIATPEPLARIYSRDLGVVTLAMMLLPIAGVFQIFDGMHAVSLGLLRGLGDTRVPMLTSIVGFWCLGIPASLWFAFGLEYGAVGLWWGLVVGLAIVAAILIVRIRQHERRGIRRVVIDERPAGAPEVY